MSQPDFEVRVGVGATTKAWRVLEREIPRGAELRGAEVVLTPQRAYVSATYVGRKPDGTPHLRPTTQTITLDSHFGEKEFLKMAYGRAWQDLLSPFLDLRR